MLRGSLPERRKTSIKNKGALPIGRNSLEIKIKNILAKRRIS